MKRIAFVDQLLVVIIWEKNIRFIYYPKEYLVNLSPYPKKLRLSWYLLHSAKNSSEQEQNARLKTLKNKSLISVVT